MSVALFQVPAIPTADDDTLMEGQKVFGFKMGYWSPGFAPIQGLNSLAKTTAVKLRERFVRRAAAVGGFDTCNAALICRTGVEDDYISPVFG